MKYIKLLFVLLLTATFVRLLHSDSHWLLEIVTHLPIQIGLSFVLISILFLKKREIRLGVVSIIFAALNFSVLIERKKPPINVSGESFALYIANIFHYNPLNQKVLSDLQDQNAEIVFLSEVNLEIYQFLKDDIQNYEFRVENPSSGTEGFIFLSHFPMENYQVIRLKDQGKRPIFIAELLINNVLVTWWTDKT